MMTYLILILWLISPVVLLLVADSFGLSLSTNFRADYLGMDRVLESLLPRLRTLLRSRQGRTDDLSGVPGICLLSLRSAPGPGDAPNSRGGLEASRATQRQARHDSRFSRHFPTLSWRPVLPGPSLDGNPVLWREWHRSKPSRLLRVVWMLYSALGILWIVLSFNALVVNSPR